MTGWVNYEQKEYAIAFDADRRCVYLDRNAGEKLFVTGKSCGTFYCYAAVLLSGKCDPAVAGPVRQTELREGKTGAGRKREGFTRGRSCWVTGGHSAEGCKRFEWMKPVRKGY